MQQNILKAILVLLAASVVSAVVLNAEEKVWQKEARASASSRHSVTFWTPQNNIADICDSLLMNIADPGSLSPRCCLFV